MDRKESANDTRQPSSPVFAQGSEATATLPQRIGESASGLLKESFQRPSPKAVTGGLASLKSHNAKSGSSSNSTGSGESSLAFRSSSYLQEATFDQCESFRLNEKIGSLGRNYGQVAFDYFLVKPNNFEDGSEFAQDGYAFGGDQQPGVRFGVAENTLIQVQETETWRMQGGNGGNDDFTYPYGDGAAVVALLSDPAFMANEEPSSTLDPENDREEGRHYEQLRAGKGSARPIDAFHSSGPLGLIPDFAAPWNSSDTSSVSQRGVHKREHLLGSKVGGIQPWIDIRNRYHDEVWGDVLPFVQEAREEMRAANADQARLQNGPAIRRLKMVLQHLGNLNTSKSLV